MGRRQNTRNKCRRKDIRKRPVRKSDSQTFAFKGKKKRKKKKKNEKVGKINNSMKKGG
jgi:hypothetical protein